MFFFLLLFHGEVRGQGAYNYMFKGILKLRLNA